MTAGEWHENVWCLDNWHEDVWTDFGTALPPVVPDVIYSRLSWVIFFEVFG